ncbi:DUF5804 family protein [Haloarcula salinisoli]|uniref:Uncharacterized protein n=1 Tax=Haloarcula salinisoli TaxID=2487746 RepID=A0A8J7YGP9_9EURY|nr:DUF5804 family protein [Halomicroarcula salinisoli]MBX0285804.1 hypothetical protein [Halomicroarcula salinisoli]MBX0302709.1 hypothetical protein [Halomicroarcula salinisoli]
MAQVCLVGSDDVNLRYELLSRETARNALVTYDLREPFENTLQLETVSLGAAVALLNDLNWYLVRFTDAAFVKVPSISESEWLSRELATAIRDDEVAPDETGRFLMVYGIEESEVASEEDEEPASQKLVEPMLLTRTGETIPEYDLREVADTLVVRVTESEFGA